MAKQAKDKWFVDSKRRHSLLEKTNLIKLFTVCFDIPKLEDFNITIDQTPAVNTILTIKNEMLSDTFLELLEQSETTYCVLHDDAFTYGLFVEEKAPRLVVLNSKDLPPFELQKKFFIEKDDIENYQKIGEFTTYGRYIVNYFCLAEPCKDIIPYSNKIWNVSKIESEIYKKVRDGILTVEQCGRYTDNAYFLGSFGELIVPVFSEKSLTTDPKILEYRDAQYKKHAHELDDPVVCVKIEDELIAMDKNYLKGDPAMGFLGDSSKKFNLHRKRQYLTAGLFESFEKEKGKYSFIKGSLSEGWKVDSFVTLANEIRKGSYERGISTANAGVLTKYILRLFQNARIVAEDCKTKHSLFVPKLTESLAKSFIGQNIVEGNSLVSLTEQNMQSYIGKAVNIRSFMFCEQTGGYCFTCAGETFRKLNAENVGSEPLQITANLMAMSMKAMHGTKVSQFEIDDLDEFLM